MLFYEKYSLSFDDRSPIYRQIILEFSRSFVRGDISPGERLPSIRDLSVSLKVNANTVQRVYQEMERDGIITAKRGTGYFFTEETEMLEKIRRDLTEDSLNRFVSEMAALGLGSKDIFMELLTYMKGVMEYEHDN